MKSLVLALITLLTLSATAVAESKSIKQNTTRYVALEPPLVINVDENGSLRFLQVTTQVSVKSPDADKLIEQHMAPIRHALIMLLSGKPVSELRTVAGKEDLRKQAGTTLRKILKKQTGSTVVNTVYFTSFIIQ